MTRSQLRYPGKVLVIGLPLAAGGCSAARADSGPPACSLPAGLTWTRLNRTRTLTDGAVVVVARDHTRTVAVISGLGEITPAVTPASGPPVTADEVLADLANNVLPIQPEAGPEPEPLASFDSALREPGRYVVFTGADMVKADYAGACGRAGKSSGSPERSCPGPTAPPGCSTAASSHRSTPRRRSPPCTVPRRSPYRSSIATM